MSGTGLPLWSKQFGQVKHTLDPTLIAGLLTAIKGFSNQTIGSDLQEIVVESDRLHNFLVSDSILFTVHIDKRVPIERIDRLLNYTKEELIKIASENELPLEEIENLSFKKFQKLVEVLTPALERLALEIDNLRHELLVIYDESSFDSAQLRMLGKISEIVPLLTKNQLSLTIKDLKTKKIHFQQITAEIEFDKKNSITNLVSYIESQPYFLKDLERNISLVFISTAAISIFKVPQVDNIFIIIKDNMDVDNLIQFRKIIVEIQKKIIDFYKT